MFQETNQEMLTMRANRHRACEREKRLTNMVQDIDNLLFALEELNLVGKDRVPKDLRDRAATILQQVPRQDMDEALIVRYRVNTMMDVLFRAQGALFRARDPYYAEDEEDVSWAGASTSEDVD